MSHAAFVITGWSVSAAAVLVYAVAVIRRGRSLSERVAPHERRWSG